MGTGSEKMLNVVLLVGTGAANTFIPEPSTFFLVALGLGLLGLRRRSA